MIYLLDTNHCSRIISGDAHIIKELASHQNHQIATSVIVQGELRFMVEKSERQAENLNAVNSFLKEIFLYPITDSIANVYGELKGNILRQFGPKAKAQRRRTTLQELGFSDNDLWIAATVLQHHLALVSADQDFQRVQSIASFSLESWLKPKG